MSIEHRHMNATHKQVCFVVVVGKRAVGSSNVSKSCQGRHPNQHNEINRCRHMRTIPCCVDTISLSTHSCCACKADLPTSDRAKGTLLPLQSRRFRRASANPGAGETGHPSKSLVVLAAKRSRWREPKTAVFHSTPPRVCNF